MLFIISLTLQKLFILKFYIYFSIKMDKIMDNYNKRKNLRLIMLIIKFKI